MLEKIISNIVFTKNRPLQMHSYLLSLYKSLPENFIQTYIIYKKDLFDRQYQQLFEKYPNCVVIYEKNFHDDLVNLINSLTSKYVLFGTDDVVLFDSIDLNIINETFENSPNDILGFSLRLSLEYAKSSPDKVEEVKAAGQTVYKVNWKKSRTANLKYPFEVDATIYKTELVKKIINAIAKEHRLLKKIFDPDSLRIRTLKKVISMKNFLASLETFYNPNTLETLGYRWCKNHKNKIPDYLFFKKICAIALQINTVNAVKEIDIEKHSIKSKSGSNIEELNEMYKQGFLVDIDHIAQLKPILALCNDEFFKLKKQK